MNAGVFGLRRDPDFGPNPSLRGGEPIRWVSPVFAPPLLGFGVARAHTRVRAHAREKHPSPLHLPPCTAASASHVESTMSIFLPTPEPDPSLERASTLVRQIYYQLTGKSDLDCRFVYVDLARVLCEPALEG